MLLSWKHLNGLWGKGWSLKGIKELFLKRKEDGCWIIVIDAHSSELLQEEPVAAQ